MSTIDAMCVIPARYESTRLPGKPLIDLGGKPMIVRSYEAVRQDVAAENVIIATDDRRILKACRRYGIHRVEMTSPDCRTGTDRVAEVAARHQDVDVWVVCMGDNPFLPSGVIPTIVEALNPGVDAVVGRARMRPEDVENVSTHKAVIDADEMLLYSSRRPIPYSPNNDGEYWDQVNVYAMWAMTLALFAEYPTGPSEARETLEIHRLLEHGHKVLTVEVPDIGGHVDVPEDVERARERLERESC